MLVINAAETGHSEYMSNGKDMIKDWDVILESKVEPYTILA